MELDALRTVGEAASRTFADNQRAILGKLVDLVPQKLRGLTGADLFGSARDRLCNELQSSFANNSRYSDKLVKFAKIVEKSLADAPVAECSPSICTGGDTALQGVWDQIAVAKALVDLRAWFDEAKPGWQQW